MWKHENWVFSCFSFDFTEKAMYRISLYYVVFHILYVSMLRYIHICLHEYVGGVYGRVCIRVLTIRISKKRFEYIFSPWYVGTWKVNTPSKIHGGNFVCFMMRVQIPLRSTLLFLPSVESKLNIYWNAAISVTDLLPLQKFLTTCNNLKSTFRN